MLAQFNKLPANVIPVELALLNAQGAELPLQLAGETSAAGTTRVLSVTEAEQTFTFVGVPEKPLPSLLRGFSAPVKLQFSYSRDQLMFLMQHDSDGFNRWDAGQQLSVQVLQDLIAQHQRGEALTLDPRLVEALRSVLNNAQLDQAMVAEMLSAVNSFLVNPWIVCCDGDYCHRSGVFRFTLAPCARVGLA